MADQIKIKNLRVPACRPDGAGQGSRYAGSVLQADPYCELTIGAVLYTDTRAAGFSDEITKSVDCAAVCRLITESIKKHPCRLLEAYAEHLAEEILMEIPEADRVDLEVEKPADAGSAATGAAPAAAGAVPAAAGAFASAAATVSVAISRAWHTVDLALGSNAGDRNAYLMGAVRRMEDDPHNRRLKRSGVIEAQSYDHDGQPNFLNTALEMQTLYTPRELLDETRAMEAAAERGLGEHRGGRALDVDILFYDDCVMGESDLAIPHPDLQNRMYVLGPLSEICPGKLHPVFNKSVMRMRRELEHRRERERESGGNRG